MLWLWKEIFILLSFVQKGERPSLPLSLEGAILVLEAFIGEPRLTMFIASYAWSWIYRLPPWKT